MHRKAVPMALVPAAQAVTVQLMGPLAPYRMETCPAARLGRTAGIVKGESLLGPLCSRTVCSFSMVLSPPMPEPMIVPTRSALPSSIASPESSMAMSAQARA